MRFKAKIIEFKSISPFFEWERDGIMPYTVRQIDYKDARFRALAQWYKRHDGPVWYIKITNPATGEYFYRKIIEKRFFPGPTSSGWPRLKEWLILYLGEQIKEE